MVSVLPGWTTEISHLTGVTGRLASTRWDSVSAPWLVKLASTPALLYTPLPLACLGGKFLQCRDLSLSPWH